jgi:hypothetical protein
VVRRVSAAGKCEQGLILSKQNSNGDTPMTRPMCKYPAYPRYGTTDDRRAEPEYPSRYSGRSWWIAQTRART